MTNTNAPERIWATVGYNAAHGMDTGGEFFPHDDMGGVEYVRADLAQPRVKPLVWRIGSHKSDYGDYQAYNLSGSYECREHRELPEKWEKRWSLWLNGRCLGDKPGGIRETGTLKDQQAAAQAHSKLSILSALEGE